MKLQDDIAAGKDVCLTLKNVRSTIDELTARRESREKELLAMRHVIPAGLLAKPKGQSGWSADVEACKGIEMIAMKAVMDTELAMGNQVIDVSTEKCDWDVTSIPALVAGKIPTSRHIEVKGHVKGSNTITETKNEILYGLNWADKFILAIVLVDGDQHEGPYYVTKPFAQEPGWAVSSINLNLKELLQRAEKLWVA